MDTDVTRHYLQLLFPFLQHFDTLITSTCKDIKPEGINIVPTEAAQDQSSQNLGNDSNEGKESQ
jgi:hypothetical protein